MPDIPLTNVDSRALGYSFVDTRGQTRSTNIDVGPEDYAGTELADFRAAIGDVTNAGLYEAREALATTARITDATAVDESESSVNTVLVIQTQDVTGGRKSFVVPAPDVSVLTEDGSQLIVGDAGATAGTPEKVAADFRAALLAVINNSTSPAGTHSIVRTYVTTYKGRGVPRPSLRPNIVEGGASGAPPAEPAT